MDRPQTSPTRRSPGLKAALAALLAVATPLGAWPATAFALEDGPAEVRAQANDVTPERVAAACDEIMRDEMTIANMTVDLGNAEVAYAQTKDAAGAAAWSAKQLAAELELFERGGSAYHKRIAELEQRLTRAFPDLSALDPARGDHERVEPSASNPCGLTDPDAPSAFEKFVLKLHGCWKDMRAAQAALAVAQANPADPDGIARARKALEDAKGTFSREADLMAEVEPAARQILSALQADTEQLDALASPQGREKVREELEGRLARARASAQLLAERTVEALDRVGEARKRLEDHKVICWNNFPLIYGDVIASGKMPGIYRLFHQQKPVVAFVGKPLADPGKDYLGSSGSLRWASGEPAVYEREGWVRRLATLVEGDESRPVEMFVHVMPRIRTAKATAEGLSRIGFVKGFEDGTIRPNAKITRAQATVMLRRLLPEGAEDCLDRPARFTDVRPGGAWFSTDVLLMSSIGVAGGKKTARGLAFDPEAPITRAEFAALAVRLASLSDKREGEFSDLKGHWAEDAVRRACGEGWIRGYEDGTFKPNAPITRAEAAAIVNRMVGNRSVQPELPAQSPWRDVTPHDWHYAELIAGRAR